MSPENLATCTPISKSPLSSDAVDAHVLVVPDPPTFLCQGQVFSLSPVSLDTSRILALWPWVRWLVSLKCILTVASGPVQFSTLMLPAASVVLHARLEASTA